MSVEPRPRDDAAVADRTRLHLHIKNNREGEQIFRVTPERLADARSRHQDIAEHLTTTLDWDTDRFAEHMASAHGLVTWDLPTESLAVDAPNLRWIHIIGAGVEHLQPLDWLPDGVSLTNNRGIHAAKAGEYGLMALLMLNNKMPTLATAQRNRNYIELFTSTIVSKTLLVIGAGNMGSAVARQAKRHGLHTIGIRRRPEPSSAFDEMHSPDRLDDLLPIADFVLVSAPLTSATRGLIDATRLALMKPTAGLINMARAQIVDYGALGEALISGAISGAVLDVFDPEPLPAESPLWNIPNLVMTPHNSSDDEVWYIPLTLDLVFANAARLMDGSPLVNTVDPEFGY